jgi:hypothetical protein
VPGVRLHGDAELIAEDHVAGHAPDRADDAWPDLAISLEPTPPRIDPGIYFARSIAYDRFELRRWGRRLVIAFEIYDRNPLDDTDAAILATLRGYFRLPDGGRPLRPSSKLGRVYAILGTRPKRLDRIPLNVLRHRLWSVRVRDVLVSSEPDRLGSGGQRPLHARQRYSIVDDIVEHWG